MTAHRPPPTRYGPKVPATPSSHGAAPQGRTIQRTIAEYITVGGKSSGQSFRKSELKKRLKAHFPDQDDATIDDYIQALENSSPTFTSWDSIIRPFGAWNRGRVRSNPTGGCCSHIQMPRNQTERKNFAFTTRTQLNAQIYRPGEVVTMGPFGNNGGDHAEDQLLAHLRTAIAERRVDPTRDHLVITINNHPCDKRCSINLATFKRTIWFGPLTIRYANPYEENAESFIRARKRMRDEGIGVRGFDPSSSLPQSEWDSFKKKEQDRFAKLTVRRRAFRKAWNAKHPDDASDGSDDEGRVGETLKKKYRIDNKRISEYNVEKKLEEFDKKHKISKLKAKAERKELDKLRRIRLQTAEQTRRIFIPQPVNILPGHASYVSTAGYNCAIRALARSGGYALTELQVAQIGQQARLNAGVNAFTFFTFGEGTGDALLNVLDAQIPGFANRGIHVYHIQDNQYVRSVVRNGPNPISIFLDMAGAHYWAL